MLVASHASTVRLIIMCFETTLGHTKVTSQRLPEPRFPGPFGVPASHGACDLGVGRASRPLPRGVRQAREQRRTCGGTVRRVNAGKVLCFHAWERYNNVSVWAVVRAVEADFHLAAGVAGCRFYSCRVSVVSTMARTSAVMWFECAISLNVGAS